MKINITPCDQGQWKIFLTDVDDVEATIEKAAKAVRLWSRSPWRGETRQAVNFEPLPNGLSSLPLPPVDALFNATILAQKLGGTLVGMWDLIAVLRTKS